MSKQFSSQTATPKALDGVNLEIRQGEFFSLLGPSGCGKTTLLRIISGLETATSGELYWRDQRFDHIKPQDRPFNMVFQRYGLFPHLTVTENVAFGLQVKGVAAGDIKTRVDEILRLVDLQALYDRLPETLSGGQAQRVAVARAVVNRPQILLLDEPLSALDQKMREHMQTELRELQRRLGITFILVTHDQEEALALSDRIAVMNHGRVEQVSTPQELYDSPKTYFVAQFIGGKNVLAELNSKHDLFIRPEKLRVKPAQNDNCIETQILNVAFKGLHLELSLGLAGQPRLRALIAPHELTADMRVGSPLKVYFDHQDTCRFARPES